MFITPAERSRGYAASAQLRAPASCPQPFCSSYEPEQRRAAGSLDAILLGTLVVSVVISVLFLAATVVFAFLMKRGHNWARWVLGAVTVLSLTGIVSDYGLGAGRFVIGAIATVLVFLPASNAYFRAVKASKN